LTPPISFPEAGFRLRVPVVVIGPPDKPVPELILVTDPTPDDGIESTFCLSVADIEPALVIEAGLMLTTGAVEVPVITIGSLPRTCRTAPETITQTPLFAIHLY
jgi:hypothetical protein